MIKCYVDGGYRNDGSKDSNLSGYGSYKFYLENGLTETRSFKLPLARSNNEAEYLSLIELLTSGLESFNDKIIIYMDSQLVVNQVNNRWKVNYKNLQILLDKIKSLNLNFELEWIPRESIVKELGH